MANLSFTRKARAHTKISCTHKDIVRYYCCLSTKVVIRVRPPLPREVDGERMFQNIVSVDKDEHVITISENLDAVLAEVS